MPVAVRKLWHALRFYYGAAARLEIPARAAGLSFYTVISLFPMVWLLASLAGRYFSAGRFVEESLRFLDEFLPTHSELIAANLKAVLRKRAGMTWAGVGGLLISAQALYVNLERAINRLLHVADKRHFLKRRFLFPVWFAGMTLVLFTPLFLEILNSLVRSLGGGLPVFALFATVSARGGFALAGFFMFCLIMAILPVRRLGLARVVSAGFLFALSLQAGKAVFKAVTLANLSRYNLVYGSLASVVLALLWIFYFYVLLLFFVYWAGRSRDPAYADLRPASRK